MARATHPIICHKPNPSVCKDHLEVDIELDAGLSGRRTDRETETRHRGDNLNTSEVSKALQSDL